MEYTSRLSEIFGYCKKKKMEICNREFGGHAVWRAFQGYDIAFDFGAKIEPLNEPNNHAGLTNAGTSSKRGGHGGI
jgi:hypothetical protein